MVLSRLFILIGLLLQSTLLGSETSISEQYGHAEPNNKELAQFEYLRGHWTISMQSIDKKGIYSKLPTQFFLNAFYLDDHKTFQSIFTSSKGFFSTDLRTYNLQTKKWQVLFLNATAQRWHTFNASLIDDEMTTIVVGGFSGKEDFDVKTVHSEIKANTFTATIYRSIDNQQSWLPVYLMNYQRD
jgi:hypothetical protein